jgi:WD40 repeat protein
VAIWALPSGPRVVIPLSVRQVWDEPNRVAVAPAGDRIYLTFGSLQTHSTADGSMILGAPLGPASHVVVSPDGRTVIIAYAETGGDVVVNAQTDFGLALWGTRYPLQANRRLAGVLPDGVRYVMVGEQQVRIDYPPGSDGDTVVARHAGSHAYQPALSPDGRTLAVIGYKSMYLYDTTALGKPRKLKGGDVVGFAFHPAGRTLAVIHGGPTLVKLYDLDTLTPRAKLDWKVGPLTCVAFSADGLLGAAGTDDGRVVVWDADE